MSVEQVIGEVESSCWRALCKACERLHESVMPIDYLVLGFGDGEAVWVDECYPGEFPHLVVFLFSVAKPPPFRDQVDAIYSGEWSVGCNCLVSKGSLPEGIIALIETYGLYCFAIVESHRKKRSIVISHFAQSLDARIATVSGDSKWIGNEQNLIHAHRMRALCDAVIVGKNTLLADEPKLTTRHVSGKHPVRIIMGDLDREMMSLVANDVSPVIVTGKITGTYDYAHISQLECSRMEDVIAPSELLQQLYSMNIYSIYLEGGPNTTSIFLSQRAVDILQLHISPLLFGSGLTYRMLPVIDKVDEAICFKSYRYMPMADAIMFVGQII